MMAAILNFAILNSAILDSASALWNSDTLLSSFRFTQKHSPSIPSTLTLPKTNSIWLKLIHSHSTWWWWPSCILPSWILPSWIPPSWNQPSWFFLSNSLTLAKIGLSPFAQKNLHSFILTQLNDDSYLEFCYVGLRHCHLGFRHLVIFSQIHSKTLSLYSDSDSN